MSKKTFIMIKMKTPNPSIFEGRGAYLASLFRVFPVYMYIQNIRERGFDIASVERIIDHGTDKVDGLRDDGLGVVTFRYLASKST